MPEIKIYYSNEDLPSEYECQIRAYLRILWHDQYLYHLDAPMVSATRHPHFVVLAERHALLSAARVIWVNVEHSGQNLKMYCLGDVFTYPAFRHRGYGSQVVAAATKLIRTDQEADAAILFTEPSLESFYNRSGWEQVAGLSATVGSKDAPEPHDGFTMMLFLSQKAQAIRSAFQTHPVFLPGYGW